MLNMRTIALLALNAALAGPALAQTAKIPEISLSPGLGMYENKGYQLVYPPGLSLEDRKQVEMLEKQLQGILREYKTIVTIGSPPAFEQKSISSFCSGKKEPCLVLSADMVAVSRETWWKLESEARACKSGKQGE